MKTDKQRSDKACENNETKDKENPSTQEEKLEEPCLCLKILNFIEKHFKTVTLLLPIITIILRGIWKLPQICAERGKLSIYGLENIGIEFYSKLGEFKITESIAILVVFLACNLGSYLIVESVELKKIKKVIWIVALLLLETIPLLILANEGNGIGGFIQLIRETGGNEWIKFLIIMLPFWMTLNIAIISTKIGKLWNSFWAKLKKKLPNKLSYRTPKEESNKEGDFKTFIGLTIVFFILITTIDVAMIYTSEGKKEEQRCQFDVISELATDTHQTKFHFENKENGEAFALFPIIAENDNQYIVSRLYRSDEGEVHIDRNYHKIINKGERAVYRIPDIYNENYEEFIANIM